MILEKLRPETVRVLAGCMAYRRENGDWPPIEVVEAMAVATGASVGACTALVRGELRSEDGRVVPLDGCEDLLPAAIVPDAETAFAVIARGIGVWVRLRSPEGKPIRLRHLQAWAEIRGRL